MSLLRAWPLPFNIDRLADDFMNNSRDDKNFFLQANLFEWLSLKALLLIQFCTVNVECRRELVHKILISGTISNDVNVENFQQQLLMCFLSDYKSGSWFGRISDLKLSKALSTTRCVLEALRRNNVPLMAINDALSIYENLQKYIL